MKKYKIILTVLLVVLVAVSAVVVSGVLDINKDGSGFVDRRKLLESTSGEEGTTGASEVRPGYATVFVTDANVKLPLIKTDIEGYFYTMDKQGGVKFYSVDNGTITQVPETESYEVKAECSAQTLTAMVHILKVDDRTFGCGLFTNVLYPDVNYYAYAFFRVTDMFTSFRDTRSGVKYHERGALLLLIDTNGDHSYPSARTNDKVYSEAFVLNPDHTTSLFLSNDQRTPGMDGVDRRDYKMFTDGILDQNEYSNVLFFSGRNYVDFYSDAGGKADIMTSGGSGTNIDNVRYVVDVNELYLRRIDKNVFYLSAAGDGAFELRAYNGATDATAKVAGFTGNLKTDYLQSGDFLLNKTTGEVYDLAALADGYSASGTQYDKAPVSYKVDYAACPAGFVANWFTASADGSYCAVRGESADQTVSVALTDKANGKTTVSTDVRFRLIANINVLCDGNVIVSIVTAKTAENEYEYAQLQCRIG